MGSKLSKWAASGRDENGDTTFHPSLARNDLPPVRGGKSGWFRLLTSAISGAQSVEQQDEFALVLIRSVSKPNALRCISGARPSAIMIRMVTRERAHQNLIRPDQTPTCRVLSLLWRLRRLFAKRQYQLLKCRYGQYSSVRSFLEKRRLRAARARGGIAMASTGFATIIY